MEPIDLILARLERAKKSARGWSAPCPAHTDKSPSLAISEGQDGRVLIKCYAGCEPLAIVHALGLTLADLFPQRIPDVSPQGRTEARLAWKQTGWAAALAVLSREADVVAIAAAQVRAGRALTADDAVRLTLAIDRIEGAREVLA